MELEKQLAPREVDPRGGLPGGGRRGPLSRSAGASSRPEETEVTASPAFSLFLAHFYARVSFQYVFNTFSIRFQYGFSTFSVRAAEMIMEDMQTVYRRGGRSF